MSVPINRLISEHGLDPKSLKAAFDADTLESRPKVKALRGDIGDRIREGIERNRRDYRLFKGMDWAMDQPFYQVAHTQLKGLLSSQPDEKKVRHTVESWGLTHLLSPIIKNGAICCDPVTNKPQYSLNYPRFAEIFVPVCMAYHTIRTAKLFNDRNLNPLYKYEPVQFTKENRLRCEIVTQIIQKQATWFDYRADLRQSISQMLQYGYCINFPREAWYVEKQEDENGKEKIVREGLRFEMPHPSRMYVDGFHRMSKLNSNSGCEYLGHWSLMRYKEIFENKDYWNRDKIGIGAHSWLGLDDSGSDFLQEVYPCNMRLPDKPGSGLGGIGGTGALDRESDAAGFYNTGTANMATLVTNHFEKLIPKDRGLGTYKYPIWMRFVFASDNAVIYAEPLAFDKFPAYCYDADFNRSRFRSLTLEVMPFQELIGNYLSQWGMAVLENLNNPIFVDEEKVPTNALLALENPGNKFYSGRKYIKFRSTENYRMKIDQREAFFTPQLTHHNTAEIAMLVNATLGMLDRVLQFSSQELGQTASHEQSAKEIGQIAAAGLTRVTFTGSFVDDADYAKKAALYDAMMAHADDNITVGISSALAATEEEFKKLANGLGLTISDDSPFDPDNPASVRTVKATKSAIAIEAFASTRDAANRIDNPAIADAMSKMFIAVAGNPLLIQSVGAVQMIELLNQICVWLGLPKEFRLHGKAVDTSASPEQQAEQVKKMLEGLAEQVGQRITQAQQETLQASGQQTQQIVEQAMQAIMQQVKPLGQAVTQTAEAVAQASQVNQLQEQKIVTIAEALAQMQQAAAVAAAAAQQQAMPPQAHDPAMWGPPPQILQPVEEGVPVGVPA